MSELTMTNLIQDVAGVLEADEWIAAKGVTVVSQFDNKLASKLTKALSIFKGTSSKSGAAIAVSSPVGVDELPGVQFGPLDVMLTITVLEDPVVNHGSNGTQQMALTIARRIVTALKHYRSAGVSSALEPLSDVIVPIQSPLAEVAYEVRFKCKEHDSQTRTKVATPAMDPASGAAPQTVTITCATPGVSIYYTTDGTLPRNGNGTLYSAPVEIAAAGTLRARAYLAGSIASDTQQAVYT